MTTRLARPVLTLILTLILVSLIFQEAKANTYNVADGDVAGLIAAVNSANANPGPDTINLAPGGTYTFMSPVETYWEAAIPIISSPISINGNGATMERSAAAVIPFRLFVILSGNVHLDRLTVRGGHLNGTVGGGFYVGGSALTLTNCTITDNFGESGGGLVILQSTATIENTTISNNSAYGGYTGGGILGFSNATGAIKISNSTIFENRADGPPGFQGRGDAIADAFSAAGSIVIKNSILASPTRGAGNDCQFFTPDSRGHNVFSDSSCGQNVGGGDLIIPNLTLGALANNGGPTQTHALLNSSAAIDAIPLSDCSTIDGLSVAADQRGDARPIGTRCDIGAFETTSCSSGSQTVLVPGTASPWLAGMPNGSILGVDSAPGQSPVLVSNVAGVSELLFTVSGATDNCGFCTHPPDSDGSASFIFTHAVGAANGIGQILVPANALIGVFLDDNQPDSTAAPTATLDFSSAASRDFLSLSPQLKQSFFIGNGLTSDGIAQRIVVPAGATRLFLGNMDGSGWFNNAGVFTVSVTRVCPQPPPPPPATCSSGSQTVSVPGTASPWLAGMPNGSMLGADSAPAQSPVQVTNVAGAHQLQFAVSGAADNCGFCTHPPDSDGSASFIFTHGVGAANGIGQILAPANSLIGVFLDNNQPNSTLAPTASLDFSSPASRDYLTLSPQLKQPFFIGNGLTSGGTPQRIVVPPGATRLFLGDMDGSGWYDNAGSFTVTVNTICPDSLPPTTTAVASVAPNNAGWNNSDIDVSLSASDEPGGSGVKEISYSAIGAQAIPMTTVNGSSTTINVSAEGETTITYFATDNAGNVEVGQTLIVRIDKTVPSLSCGGTDSAWHADDVSIPCTANDNVSGLSNGGDSSFNLTTDIAANTETTNAATNSRTVCDVADNCTTAGPISGNKVDKKAPAITITTPSASASYLLNQPVTSNYTCNDAGSGVGTCAGPVATGSNIDTASAGSKAFTVNATDQVGHTATQAVSYSVHYGVEAMYDQTKVHKSGSTIPIKIRFVDANGINQSSASLLPQAMSVVLVSANSSGTPEDSGNSNPDLNFRYDASLGGYIFNLKTTGYAAGTHDLHFAVAGDTTDHVVQFRIRQ